MRNSISLEVNEGRLKWKKDNIYCDVNDMNKYTIEKKKIRINNFSEEDCGVYQGFHETSRLVRKFNTYPVSVESTILEKKIQKLKLVGESLDVSEDTISENTQISDFFPIWRSTTNTLEIPCIVIQTETPWNSCGKKLQDPNRKSRLFFFLKCAALISRNFSVSLPKDRKVLSTVEKFLGEIFHDMEKYRKVAGNLQDSSSYDSSPNYFTLRSDEVKLETLWILFTRCRSPIEVLKYIFDQRLTTLTLRFFRLEGYSQHSNETYISLPRSVTQMYLESLIDEKFGNAETHWKSIVAFDQRTCTDYECVIHYALLTDLPAFDIILKYFRTCGYAKKEGEKCIIVPAEYNEKVIEKMGVDIITHKTIEDCTIHKAVIKQLRIPEEVIGWNVKRKQRFIQELKHGKARIHRARVIVVGCAGAGKTTLVERLKHPDRDEMPTTTTTIGLDVHKNVFLVDGGKLMLMADAASLSSSSSRDKMMTVMDFAGQSAYYACHQVYLTKRAIYLLVTDMSKSMEEKVGQHVCDADGTIFADWKYGDYISFWLQSIRTYCGEEMPVVLVATHKDKLQKSEKSFYDEILHSFPKTQNLMKHLSTERYFEVEAAPKDNEKILKIQDRLIDLLTSNNEEKSYSHWGEFIPSFWLTVEKELEQNREKVMRVSQIKDRFNLELSEDIDGCLDLFRHCWFQLKVKLRVEVSKDMIKIRDMLQFFHEIGYILFFNETNLNEVAILDVQWFIDAFKSLTMDKNQVDVAKASNNSNTKTLTLEDCFETTKDMDEFYQSGKLPYEILQQFWDSHDDKDLQENSGYLLKYMERLGLLATGEIFHYIPCVNKKDIDISQLERISSKQHKTSVLHFLFKHCLHHFFFQRVVVACMHKWKYLEIDGKIQLFKNIVLLEHKQRGNVIVIGVNKTAIQLLVYSNSTSRSLRPADTYKVRNTVENIIRSVVSTFHRAVNYEVGFSCSENDNITQECEGQFILEKDAVAFSKLEEGRECDYHTETHYIHWSKMVKHWNKDFGLRLGCLSRETRNSTVEGITRQKQENDFETERLIEMKEQVRIDIDKQTSGNVNIHMTDEELKKHHGMLLDKLMKLSRDAFQIYFDDKMSQQDLIQLMTFKDDMKKDPCRFAEQQMSILFPGDGSDPSSSMFDITIMYKLLRNYGDDVPVPSQGWGKKPEFKNIKETDDLERIRLLRNMLNHEGSDTVVEKDVFKMYWMEISQAIKRLSKGKLQTELDDLQKEAGV
ncbi:uncharacterized protein LOC134261693 [Saccostrea cucullata]|uniref:uncharacterized protein LOC134261693 n=1 Tax=Saccostrea cuccullata TaxID=36930 RepID=UPI002ED43F30